MSILAVIALSGVVTAAAPVLASASPPAPAPSASPRAAVSASPQPSPPSGIEGNVYGPDGKALPDAVVLVFAEDPDVPEAPAIVRTDASGRFVVPLPRGSPFTVRVEAPGLAAATMPHHRGAMHMAVTLAPGRTIEGVVRDGATGTAAPGATVEAREEALDSDAVGWDADVGVVRAIADTKGTYRLEGLAHGLYTLTAFAPRLGRAEKRRALAGRAADLLLLPGGTVAGLATDAKGEPLARTAVRLLLTLPLGNPTPLLSTTNERGAFLFHGVPPGEYRAFGRHPDLAPAASAPFMVEADGETRAILVLAARATVRGRLVGADDKPARGHVTVAEWAGMEVPELLQPDLTAEAGDDGVFRLRTRPGQQSLEVDAPGYAPRRVETGAVAAGETVDLGDIALEVGLTIRGRVRDAAGHPVDDAQLWTVSPETFQNFTARTGHDGAYTLAGLPPGLYSVSAHAAGMGNADRRAEAGASSIDFVLLGAGSISGVVTDEAGRPVEVFRVSARGTPRGGSRSASLGAPDGRFVLDDVSPGEYMVEVSASERAPVVVPGVKVAAGAATDVGTIRLASGGTVRGLVVDAASAAIAGATVAVYPAGGPYARPGPEGITDTGGAFELSGVTPGVVRLGVSHPSYAAAFVAGVEVDPARGLAEVRVVLAQGGRIEGRVRSREGLVPAGLAVTARPLGAGAPFPPRAAVVQPVSADGSFVVEHVASGQAAVTLMSGRAGTYRSLRVVNAEVRDGETTPVEFALRSIVITGRVTRGGAPLAGARVEFHAESEDVLYVGGGTGDQPPGAAITREDGTYQLVIGEPGFALVEIQSPDRKTRYPTSEVQVPDADSYVADFNFSGAYVEGVVVDRDSDRPIARASVSTSRGGRRGTPGTNASADVDPAGRFRLEVDPGEYVLSARAEGYGGEPVTVTVGESGTSGVRLVLVAGLVIKGRVVDATGRGVPAVRVNAMTGEGQTLWATMRTTLADGSFELSGLRAGHYRVIARTEAGLFALASGIEPGTPALTLVLRPGGRVLLRVVGQDGVPVPNASAAVLAVDGRPLFNVAYGRTSAAGTIELTVPSGAVEIGVHDGAAREGTARDGKVTVAVQPGAVVSAEVSLRPSTASP